MRSYECTCGCDKFRHFNYRNEEKSPCKDCYCPRYKATKVKKTKTERCKVCGLPVGGCIC